MGKTPKKDKKEKVDAEEVEKKVVLAPIAKPLADSGLSKKASGAVGMRL